MPGEEHERANRLAGKSPTGAVNDFRADVEDVPVRRGVVRVRLAVCRGSLPERSPPNAAARISTRSHSTSVRSEATTTWPSSNARRTRGAVCSPSSQARTALDSAEAFTGARSRSRSAVAHQPLAAAKDTGGNRSCTESHLQALSRESG